MRIIIVTVVYAVCNSVKHI
uniref:Uncharacterized protein n=1 Tax=Arundo donax TaxID=35708 RepID=A0A0A9C6H5_ARUDO